MGEKLTGKSMEPTPVISITGKEGGFFVGVAQDKGKEVALKRGKKMVYSFLVKDTDFPVQLKKADGNYGDVDVAENTKVSVFAPTVLNSALQLANVGDTIKIVYLGKARGKNGEYHNFDVERI